jgi:DNA-binding transcriptional regulator YbjK
MFAGLALLIVAGWIPTGPPPTPNTSLQQTQRPTSRKEPALSPEASYDAAKSAIATKDWARAAEHLNALPSDYKDVASLRVQVRDGESLYWYNEAMTAKAKKDYPLAYQLLKQAKSAGGKLPASTEQELSSLADLAAQAEKHAASVEALQEAEKFVAWWEEDQQKDVLQRRVGTVELAQENVAAVNPSYLSSSERERYQRVLSKVRRMAVSIREQYAKQLEENFLNLGMDVVVTLEDQDKTTMRMKYVLWSRPLIRQILADSTIFDSPDMLKTKGFKRLIFDAELEFYTVDLGK